MVDLLFVIVEFFHYLLRLRRYKRKSIEVGFLLKGESHLRLNFRLKGYFSCQYSWGNDRTRTLLLEVSTQRYFVADFIRLK